MSHHKDIRTSESVESRYIDNQTDKDGNLIYLYATHADEQYSYIDAAKNKGCLLYTSSVKPKVG